MSRKSKKLDTEEMKIISMVCWSLWKNRNNIVWNQKSLEATKAVNSAILVLNQWQSVLKQWQSAQDRSFDNLFGFITPLNGKEHSQLSQMNTIKVNIDAVLFENSEHFSFSILARDHEGNMIEAKACCKQGNIAPELQKPLTLERQRL